MNRKLWIVGMTSLCTGASLVAMDIGRMASINPIHGAIAALLIAFGLVVIREE